MKLAHEKSSAIVKADKRAYQAPELKQYGSPTLKEYGAIGEIVEVGFGTGNEADSSFVT